MSESEVRQIIDDLGWEVVEAPDRKCLRIVATTAHLEKNASLESSQYVAEDRMWALYQLAAWAFSHTEVV